MTIPFNISAYFDQDLRDVPNDRAEMIAAAQWLAQQIEGENDVLGRARLLSRRGVVLRILGELNEAECDLREAMRLFEQHNAARSRTVARIRLGHVLQWAGRFAEAEELFEVELARCTALPELEELRDFVLQHAGKNLFDQGRYAEALALFREALEIRRNKGDKELIASTELACEATCARLDRG